MLLINRTIILGGLAWFTTTLLYSLTHAIRSFASSIFNRQSRNGQNASLVCRLFALLYSMLLSSKLVTQAESSHHLLHFPSTSYRHCSFSADQLEQLHNSYLYVYKPDDKGCFGS